MTINKKGGKHKHKARKDNRPRSLNVDELKKINGQEYAYVKEKYSSQHYSLLCYDKVSRLGCLRGKLRRARIKNGDLVLVSIREFQDDKCDIIYHYKEEDTDKLLKVKEIEPSFIKEGKIVEDADEDLVDSDSSDEETVVNTRDNRAVSFDDLKAAGIDFDDI